MDTQYFFRGIVLLLLTIQSVVSQQLFATEPSDVEAIQGGDVILRCVVHNLIGKVQWAKDNFALGYASSADGSLKGYPRYTMIGARESGTYNLMISNVQLEDDGVFQCQVSATETTGGLMSRAAKHNVLLPPDKPVIENGPVVPVVADKPTNLTCLANNGKPAPNVTWATAGNEITTSVTVTTLQADGKREDAVSMLEITPRKGDEGRVYECRALNRALLNGPVVTEVKLEVHFPPEVSMTLEPSLEVQEGETVKFTCQAKANPAAVTWKWFSSDEEIAGQTEAVMKMEAISRDLHTKAVTCEATNSVGSTKRSYNMNIKYGPRFNGAAVHVGVDPGEDATLKCNVDANPAPAVFWMRKEDTQTDGSRRNSGKILSSSPTLRISNVQDENFGVYTCTASAIGFDEIKMDVHLLKKGPPYITSEAEQSAKFGDTGIIECVIRSAPEPTSIVWSKEGKVMDLNDIPRYVMRSEDLPDGVRSVIEITSVQDGDFAKYNCSVENSYGKASTIINFTQREVIPLAYILGGVLAGVVILIIAGIVLFIYLRRRGSGSESGSESSEDSLAKRDEHKNDTQDGKQFDSYPIDAWRTETMNGGGPPPDQKFYRHSAEYDELNYQKDQRMNKSYDVADGYGNHGYNERRQMGAGDYGTYPGPARIYDNRFTQENPYGPLTIPGVPSENPYGTHGSTYAPSVHSEYGTYGRAPPPPASVHGSEYGTVGMPVAGPNSRLATNV